MENGLWICQSTPERVQNFYKTIRWFQHSRATHNKENVGAEPKLPNSSFLQLFHASPISALLIGKNAPGTPHWVGARVYRLWLLPSERNDGQIGWCHLFATPDQARTYKKFPTVDCYAFQRMESRLETPMSLNVPLHLFLKAIRYPCLICSETGRASLAPTEKRCTCAYMYLQKGTLWRLHFYSVFKKSLKSIFGHYIIKCSLL